MGSCCCTPTAHTSAMGTVAWSLLAGERAEAEVEKVTRACRRALGCVAVTAAPPSDAGRAARCAAAGSGRATTSFDGSFISLTSGMPPSTAHCSAISARVCLSAFDSCAGRPGAERARATSACPRRQPHARHGGAASCSSFGYGLPLPHLLVEPAIHGARAPFVGEDGVAHGLAAAALDVGGEHRPCASAPAPCRRARSRRRRAPRSSSP